MTEEVSTLIATLHETQQRLEVLTEGEVDAVADRDGRTFLLRRAQEQLRHSEAAKQAAILNALPAHIALLDTQGVIVSVNETWRFAIPDAIQDPGHAPGINYLEICGGARGEGSDEARQVAEGVRSVLDGGAKSFSIEYPCHSRTERRWFLMTVTPLADDRPNGAVVMHLNITERMRGEEALRRFAGAMDALADAILLVDRSSMRIVHVNDAACRYMNKTREQVLALEPWVWLATSRAELERTYDTLIASGVDAKPIEILRRRKDGSQVWVEMRRHAQRAGDRWTIVTLIRDVTKRRERDEELRRFRAAMDNSGDAIVLVDRASMRYIDVNQTLCDLVGYTRQELLGMTPMELFGADRTLLERDYDAIIADSNCSASKIEGQYRHKDGSLIPIETRRCALNTESGWIIVGTARDITVRKRAEQELRESERRFSDLLRNVELASLMLDRKAHITYCNEYLLRLTGWRREEVIGRNWFEIFIPPESNNEIKDVFAGLLADLPEVRHHENEILTRSGERRLIRWNNSVLRSGAGDVIGTASIGEDITEQKLAETRIKRLNRVYAVLSGINTLIVRVRDRDELFREACRIAVEQGQFKMAWIGVVNWSAMTIEPVASAGSKPEYLAIIKDQFSLVEETPMGATMTARAVREKKAFFSNDTQNDSNIKFKKEHLERGTRSLASMPLLVSGEAVGVLCLYTEEAGFFDEEEMKLLDELAGDIAFAIDMIEKQNRLDYLAYYDALTGLANRTLFLERVTQYMRSAASGGHKLAVFLVDLERFKNINDSLGRPAGDALLKQVAEWLMHSAGDANLVARVGADHFATVLPEIKPEDGARSLDKLMKAFLDHPFRLNDAVFRIGLKVGVAIFPDDGASADTLFRNAEAALKKAKESGDRYLFYTQTMNERVVEKLTLENQLRAALDKGEFVLHYQPKVSLASGKLTSAEALIRWNDPRTGLVSPGRFIPILEDTGLILEVGRWALRKAIEDYLRWRAAGLAAVRIAVNVSPLQLRNRGFIEEIRQAISSDAHAAAGLELELTESLIMEDVKHSIASLQAIRAMGVSVAIDDFGTGFSSLSYLAKLPVDTLKIDRSFVIDMTGGPEGLALVSTIINLAHSLSLKVVAEGVETDEQSRLLRLLKCDEMQGFLFSKPVPGEIFETRFLAPPPAR